MTFDKKAISRYEKEAKERYGKTDAYQESLEKTASYSENKWADVLSGLVGVFSEFSACKKKGLLPDSTKAQNLVQKLQNYITENFYTCTNEILFGLGQMYVCDERFQMNIDQHGEGTAHFVSEAISFYCGK